MDAEKISFKETKEADMFEVTQLCHLVLVYSGKPIVKPIITALVSICLNCMFKIHNNVLKWYFWVKKSLKDLADLVVVNLQHLPWEGLVNMYFFWVLDEI